MWYRRIKLACLILIAAAVCVIAWKEVMMTLFFMRAGI